MGREPRKNGSGIVYHVMARGNNREALFLSDQDRETYLRLWRKYSKELGFEVYAYVLMTNHVHWLIRTGQVPISTIIHSIHGLYARNFNQTNQRAGHVFQGRFKSEVCTEDRYILSLCRYIHRNPLKAGLVKKLIDYPWSSYPDICGARKDGLVNRGFFLGYFGQPAVGGLRKWVEEENDMYQQESDFIIQPEHEGKKYSEERPSLEKIALAIVERYQTSVEDLQGEGRLQYHVKARRQFIVEAVQEHSYKRSEVARFLKKDRSLVTKIIQKELYSC